MLSIHHGLFIRWSSIVVWHFVLLMTETSSLNAQEKSTGPHDARLVEGGSLCSGRLEMKHQGEWRALNTNEKEARHKVVYAQVACRQMDCGSVISIVHNTNNAIQRPAWEVNFFCAGTESTLRECSSVMTRRRVQKKTNSSSSLEVVCSESLRVSGAAGVCTGEMMVRSDQGWLAVCQDGFDSEALAVACRELGCVPPQYSTGPVKTEVAPVLSKQFQCKGNESRLEDCDSSIRSSCRSAARLSCSPADHMRAVGGENHCEGTVEAKRDGEWKPLEYSWRYLTLKHSSYICEQIGCAHTVSFSRSLLPKRRPVWELSHRCAHDSPSMCKIWEESGSDSVITVNCTVSVRLVRGPERCSGLVELKSGQSWVSPCSRYFSSEDALVTCRELKCGFPHEYYGKTDSGEVWDQFFECDGKEKHLMDCPTTVRNMTDEESHECDSTYLTCKELPPEPYITVMSAEGNLHGHFPEVWKGHRFAISCGVHTPYEVLSIRLRYRAGADDHLTEQIQSPHDGLAIFRFLAAQDARGLSYHCDYNFNFSSEIFSAPETVSLTVKENNYARLVSEHSRCAGRLEVGLQKEWRPVSYQHSWSLREASVVCRQLQCGSAVSTSQVHNSTGPLRVWRFYTDCDGSEHALMDCGKVKKWISSDTVEVICSGVLLRPVITVLPSHGLSDNSQQEMRLLKDHSFTVNCSVEPQYPGGHFSLIFTGLNQTHSYTQPAVNHSAYFTYTADWTHQGDCRCVYHNFVFNHNFSSESLSLPLIVDERDEVWLDDGELREDDSVCCAGKLFVFDEEGTGVLVSAETTVWDMKHASLVCRQMHCGSAVSTKVIDLLKVEAMGRFLSDCDGSESSLMDCGAVMPWFSSTAIEVVCTGYEGAAGKKT